ncbi:MAG: nucleoside triphosphate pyrophosphohydrolase [Candidatus Sericytochromatia bacterium]|nr:nucleoside triphosphate pyrophosphohydrolase [Candidatus Sericytochromatia bacterium]
MTHPITVVGLGPGDPDLLTVAADRTLRAASHLYLRTARHPTVAELDAQGLAYTAFDTLYERETDFDQLYERIVDTLAAAAEQAPVCYAVPGHPLVAESTVQRLLKREGLTVTVLPGLSGVEATYALLGIDPTHGMQLLDALALEGVRINPTLGALVVQVYSKRVASLAKIQLMRFFPDEHPVKLVRAASVPGQELVRELPLYELDRHPELIDHLTSLYLPPAPAVSLDRLRDIIARLRGPGGCPWDIEQTHASLRKYMLEEAYEAVEAIDADDDQAMAEELGDVLLQVVLHAQIAEEREAFDLDEVAETLCDKLVFRHPHVFGEASVRDSAEVLANWDVLKAAEKQAAGASSESRLGRVPPMAALSLADKVMGRAAKAGFDWPSLDEAFAKVDEEWAELREAVRGGEAEAVFHEWGDFLYALVNVSRRLRVDPEDALRQAVRRFTARFQAMEAIAEERGLDWEALDLATRKSLWQSAKLQERAPQR